MSTQQRTIKDLNEYEFISVFNAALEKIIEDPLANFIEAPGFLNLEPYPAQRVILKIAFNQKLDDVKKYPVYVVNTVSETDLNIVDTYMTEVEMYEMMTSTKYEYPMELKNRINFIAGRRSGKSLLAAVLALYFAIVTNYKPYLKKHPYATVLILSHSKEFSEELLELIKNLIYSSPILERLLDVTEQKRLRQSVFNLRVPFKDGNTVEYSKVMIRIGAADKRTVRGKAVCVLICDEIAFWNLSEKSVDTDEEILRAARPSLSQFQGKGYIFKLSSPGIKQGTLYNEYSKFEQKTLPNGYVIFKAPTWVWNRGISEETYREEFKVDPTGFWVEFGANFADSISNFISPDFVDACVVKGHPQLMPEAERLSVTYHAAIDAAFKKDRFVFTIVGHSRGKIRQYVLKKWEGSQKKPVKASEVAAQIKQICEEYDITQIYADQFAFQPLSEIFSQYGLTLEEKPFTVALKRQIFFNLKKLIHNKQIDILDDDVLVNEIKQLQVEQTNNRNIKIHHPPGGSDDAVCALAVATFFSAEDMLNILGADELNDVYKETKYNITVDATTGRALTAPAPEMLMGYWGPELEDTSDNYTYDPVKKEWVKKEEDEDGTEEDDSTHILF